MIKVRQYKGKNNAAEATKTRTTKNDYECAHSFNTNARYMLNTPTHQSSSIQVRWDHVKRTSDNMTVLEGFHSVSGMGKPSSASFSTKIDHEIMGSHEP